MVGRGTTSDVGDAERDQLEVWAARATRGDEDSLSRLLDRAQPLITAYCRRRLATDSATDSVEDVAQEVCAAIIKALPSYRNDHTSFLPFLYRITARKVADAHRHLATARRHLELVGEIPETVDDGRGPEQTVMHIELVDELDPLLARLPPQQSRVLSLRVLDGLSAQDTARRLGSTCGAVRVAQHRALTVLRAMMTDASASPTDAAVSRVCG